MIRMLRRHLAVVPIVTTSLLLASCGGDDGGTDPDPLDAVASVTVTPGTGQVDLGGTLQLSASVRNGRNEEVTSTVTWTSSDGAVAGVSANGLVTGVAPGTAVITARAAGVSGTATVESRDPNPPLAPGNVQATAVSDTEIDVSWSDNSNSETGHLILREAVGAAPAGVGAAAAVFEQAGTVGPNVTTFRDSGLLPSTTYRYQVDACNDAGCSGGVPAGQEPSTHPTLTIDTSDLPEGLVGAAYAFDFTSSGPEAVWTLVGGELPAGLELSSSGTLSGTPTEGGQFAPEIMAQGGGQMVSAVFPLVIVTPPGVVTTSLPTGIRGNAYGASLEASGGNGVFAWSVVGGGLPPGVSLGADGALSGTPTLAGSFAFTAQVASAGLQASAPLTLTIFDPLGVTTPALSAGVLDNAYSATLQAQGGDGAYTWSLTSGSLPAGLSLDAGTGAITGTPTALGTSDFSVQVNSGDGQVDTADLSITVNEQVIAPSVTTTTLPDGGAGAAYSAQLQATDGDGTYQWAVVAGALPAGLALDAGTGAITGTPTAAGTAGFTVQVTSASLTGTAALTIDVAAALAVTTTTLPPGIEGAGYAAGVAVSGGDGAPAFSVASGSLPAGLSLDGGTGAITGTPTPAPPPVSGPLGVGTSAFTIEATNALGQTAQQALSISIFLPLSVTTASLADGTVGVGYSQGLAASGGDGANTWSVTAGSLPTGLNLAAGTGVIGGTPTTGGTFNFTVQAVSGDAQVATADLSITVAFAPPGIGTTSLPDGVVGQLYTQSVTVSGGDGSYVWAITAGALPDGLSLGAGTGLITGTPTTQGTANFTVEVTSAGMTASQALSITINAAAASCSLVATSAGFDIQLCYVSSVSSAVQTAFDNAVSRWESLITGDVADIAPPSNAHTACVSGGGPPLSGAAIDDLVIYVLVEPIDGEFGVLGSAGPCFIRGSNALPMVGTMRFDVADMARLDTNGQLESVILHEMGHVLGIGTLWSTLGFLQNAATPGETDPSVSDTHFNGAAAIAAFDGAGGAGRVAGAKVPVQNVGNPGSINGHWRETVFDFELMTPFLDGGVANPLSAVSVSSLGDLGYTVSAGSADAFTVPFPDATILAAPSPEDDVKIPFLDDILDLPIRVVDDQGRLVRILPSPAGGN